MSCPEVEELERYTSDEDAANATGTVRRHLESCSECRARVIELRENQGMESMVRRVFARSPALGAAGMGDRFGPYQIVRELGRGGTGVVYEAEQENPRRRVALKVISGELARDPRHDRLLQRECRALARLRHSSIAAIYDAGRTHDGRSYFAMELVEGEPLAIYAERRGLELTARLELFASVCDTVAYAHQRGVLHRDLKPSNILVEANGAPKVLDFGLARVLEVGDDGSRAPASSMLSEPGRVFGTLPYMSPEHVRGAPDDIDVRSDVYSLGVVLFELLTGRMPYDLQPGNLLQAVRTISEQRPASPRALAGHVPAEVETIVLKALEKDPQRRYQSASEFAADLRRFLRHEPIIARPPTPWYQLRKLVRRNRALAITVVIAVALLLSVTAAAVDRAYEAIRERDAAERRLELARHSVNYLFLGVGGQMAARLGTADIQRHLAEEAFVFYKRIAEESPDDLAEQAGYWDALRRLISDSVVVGRLDRAELLAEQLRVSMEAAAARSPDDLGLMRERARGYPLLSGMAARAGRPDEARRYADQIVPLCREVVAFYEAQFNPCNPHDWTIPDVGALAGNRPDIIAAREELAGALMTRAGGLLAGGDIESAEKHYAEALQIISDLERTDPTMEPIYRRDTSGYAPLAGPILLNTPARPRYQQYRSTIVGGLGDLAAAHGDGVQAAVKYREAIEILEKLFAESPRDPAVMATLAAAQERMACSAEAAGDLATARAHLGDALGAWERLAAADPVHVGWRQQLSIIREQVRRLGVGSTDEHQ